MKKALPPTGGSAFCRGILGIPCVGVVLPNPDKRDKSLIKKSLQKNMQIFFVSD
jgi:hypothetical protein